MPRVPLIALLLAAVLPTAAPAAEPQDLLLVDNGVFFYDSNNDCIGDTNTAAGAKALRHWHVGLPFLNADAEPAGGWGCAPSIPSAPATYGPVVVPSGKTAVVSGLVRYTWDTNVPGGGLNDVQLHIYDVRGERIYSTLDADGPRPVIPNIEQVREHTISTQLGPGTYTFTEDVFSGEHSAWLTRLRVTLAA